MALSIKPQIIDPKLEHRNPLNTHSKCKSFKLDRFIKIRTQIILIRQINTDFYLSVKISSIGVICVQN